MTKKKSHTKQRKSTNRAAKPAPAKQRDRTNAKRSGAESNAGKTSAAGRRTGKSRATSTTALTEVDAGVQHAAPLMLAPPAVARPRRQSRSADAKPPTDASHELSSTELRLGLAAADQQRVLNNLDRPAGSPAPLQTGPAHPPRNAKFVAAHAGLVEDELERGSHAIAKLRDQQLIRRLLWDLGLARKPRAAIVGRAIYELGATSQKDASKAKNGDIAGHINIAGKKHHLSVKLRNLIETATTKAGKDYSSALAGYLNRPLALLRKYYYLRASRPGVYLVGDGLTMFVDFPRWEWRDEEGEQKLRRPPPRRPRS